VVKHLLCSTLAPAGSAKRVGIHNPFTEPTKAAPVGSQTYVVGMILRDNIVEVKKNLHPACGLGAGVAGTDEKNRPALGRDQRFCRPLS
jgi:hypothetical protein